MEVEMFILLSLSGFRGDGAAAGILRFTGNRVYTREKSLSQKNTTRNILSMRMFLTLARLLVKPCTITVYMSDGFLRDNMERVEQWKQDGWKNRSGEPPANLGLWKQVYMLNRIHTLVFKDYNGTYREELSILLREERGNV